MEQVLACAKAKCACALIFCPNVDCLKVLSFSSLFCTWEKTGIDSTMNTHLLKCLGGGNQIDFCRAVFKHWSPWASPGSFASVHARVCHFFLGLFGAG